MKIIFASLFGGVLGYFAGVVAFPHWYSGIFGLLVGAMLGYIFVSPRSFLNVCVAAYGAVTSKREPHFTRNRLLFMLQVNLMIIGFASLVLTISLFCTYMMMDHSEFQREWSGDFPTILLSVGFALALVTVIASLVGDGTDIPAREIEKGWKIVAYANPIGITWFILKTSPIWLSAIGRGIKAFFVSIAKFITFVILGTLSNARLCGLMGAATSACFGYYYFVLKHSMLVGFLMTVLVGFAVGALLSGLHGWINARTPSRVKSE